MSRPGGKGRGSGIYTQACILGQEESGEVGAISGGEECFTVRYVDSHCILFYLDPRPFTTRSVSESRVRLV